MNGFYVLVFAFTIIGAVYFIPRAIRHDMNLTALENLDDEPFAADASAAWNRGDWS